MPDIGLKKMIKPFEETGIFEVKTLRRKRSVVFLP